MTTNTATDNARLGWNDERSETAESLEAEYGLGPNVSVPDEDVSSADEKKGTNRQIGGAAIAAGVAGTLLLGPAVGVLAGIGAAGGAALGKGPAGNVTRATGDVVASAGERLRNFDKKHQITSKTSKGFVKGANWVSDKLKVKDKRRNNAGEDLTT